MESAPRIVHNCRLHVHLSRRLSLFDSKCCYSYNGILRVSTIGSSQRLNGRLSSQAVVTHSRGCLCVSEHNEINGFQDIIETCTSNEGSDEKNETSEKGLSSTKLFEKLKRYGISGILSYGILNTLYYSIAFLVVWLYVAPAPTKMGFLPAAKRFLKIMAMVWAGSQVTKLIRAAGALALAPAVDRGLSWFTNKYGFQSQGQAFMAIVLLCCLVAAILLLGVTLLWA